MPNYSTMKEVRARAKKYESKKSLNGPMKFLKGNVRDISLNIERTLLGRTSPQDIINSQIFKKK